MSSETPEQPPRNGDAEAPRTPGRKRWLRRTLLLLGPLVVVIGGGIVYFTTGRYVGTEDAYVKADKVMVAAEVSGLISEVDVRENQHVNKGDVLFRIDDRPYRIALAEADAKLAGTRDQITSLKATYRQKAEELSLARINTKFAQRQFDRQAKLINTNAVSRSKYDSARHDLDVARQNIRVIQQEMAQLRAQLAGNPDTPVDKLPQYLQAKAARDQAALDLDRTVVRAPFAGIASKTPQVGQQVAGGAVMSVVADNHVWIEANYKETDLTHVRPGQPVTIQVDTYPGREWHGTVQSISQATGAEFSIIPPQNATGNWVKVVQRIPVRIAVKTDGKGPDLRAGMSTSVEIDSGYRRPVPGFVRTALAWVDMLPTVHTAEAEEHK